MGKLCLDFPDSVPVTCKAHLVHITRDSFPSPEHAHTVIWDFEFPGESFDLTKCLLLCSCFFSAGKCAWRRCFSTFHTSGLTLDLLRGARQSHCRQYGKGQHFQARARGNHVVCAPSGWLEVWQLWCFELCCGASAVAWPSDTVGAMALPTSLVCPMGTWLASGDSRAGVICWEWGRWSCQLSCTSVFWVPGKPVS